MLKQLYSTVYKKPQGENLSDYQVLIIHICGSVLQFLRRILWCYPKNEFGASEIQHFFKEKKKRKVAL